MKRSSKHRSQILPIRLKVEMAQAVASVIHCLGHGQKSLMTLLLDDLKAHALFLDDAIQQDVLAFAEQVQFQMHYDPYHNVTLEVEQAADKLVEDMGFCPPPYFFSLG